MKKCDIKKSNVINILVSIVSYLLCMIFYYIDLNVVSSIILIFTSFLLLYLNKKREGYYTNILGVFSFIWFFSVGLSVLRLHQAQNEWNIITWICIALTYIAFNIGFMLKRKSKNEEKINKTLNKKSSFIAICVLFALVFLSLILEILIRRYVPLFSNDMASYQNFSVTGIHYFTVSSALILPLTYLFCSFYKGKITKKEYVIIIIINIIALFIPFLIVSRQLILTTLILTGFCIMSRNRKKEFKIILIVLVALLLCWGFVSKSRNQDDQYLKNALQIQENSILSTSSMQMYMYVTMNFDNFDYNVSQDFEYYYGSKSLFPVFAFTGLKFINNYFVDVTVTANKIIPVYNTYPIFTAPYFDFGIIGVCAYMVLIGYICALVNNLSENNVENMMLKSLIKYALLFSFFISYFSNPTFWFYIAVILIIKFILDCCNSLGRKEK